MRIAYVRGRGCTVQLGGWRMWRRGECGGVVRVRRGGGGDHITKGSEM